MVERGSTEAGATFDKRREYRYTLWRTWRPLSSKGYVNFIMLNPSTADEHVLDPTVRRCVGFAQDWGYDGLYVTNLFALRATDPKQLYAHAEPVGRENDAEIHRVADNAALVVAGWGTHGALNGRDEEVKKLLANIDVKCLKLTKDGHPGHPLYLAKTLLPIDFCPGGVGELVS